MDGIRHFLSLLRWQTTNNSFNTMHYFYFLNLRKGIRTFLFCFTSSEVWQHFAESLENLSREFGQHVDLCDESCSCCWRHLNLQTASFSLYFHIVIDDIDQKQQLYIAPQNTWNPQEKKNGKIMYLQSWRALHTQNYWWPACRWREKLLDNTQPLVNIINILKTFCRSHLDVLLPFSEVDFSI